MMCEWLVCVLTVCSNVLITVLIHHRAVRRKPARGEKSILYSQVMLGISDKHFVLPSRVHINFAANKTESVRLKKRVGDNSKTSRRMSSISPQSSR